MLNKRNILDNFFKHPYIGALLITLIKVILNLLIEYTAYIPVFLIILWFISDNKKCFMKEIFKGNIYLYIIGIISLCVSFYYIRVSLAGPDIAKISLAIVFIMQAIDEELIFRYIFFHKQELGLVQKKKIVYGSLLFSILHFVNIPMLFGDMLFMFFVSFGIRFVSSALFGFVFLKHHMILEVALLHYLFNVVGLNDVKMNIIYIILMTIYVALIYRHSIKAMFLRLKAEY